MPGQDPQEPQKSRNLFKSSAKWLWRLFSSVRLALILVLVIAGLSLSGALTPIRVFNSIYFAVVGIALMLNIFVCSLNRWKSIRLALRGGEVDQPENFYKTGIELKGIQLSCPDLLEKIEKVLVKNGYRVRKSSGESVGIAADKNRYFRLGTYLSHFSLILFVLAFLFGSHFGFRDTGFWVIEGETKAVGHDTELSLKLVSFVYETYQNGMPRDYRSQVVLYENGQQVKETLIRVNHPLYYNGVRFYQSFFGKAAKMQIRSQEGQILFDDSVLLDTFSQDPRYYQGYLDLPEYGMVIRLITSSDAEDPMIPAGNLAVGIIQNNEQTSIKLVQQDAPDVINGLEFDFKGIVDYSGFQVSRDPANALIWIASGLFIIGICSVFYFPHLQVWVRCRNEPEGRRLLIRIIGRAGLKDDLIKDMEKVTGIQR